ncbi:MAG: DHA2 family efflux MFS transporter permease subunit [Bacteroidota bacterium]
MAIALRRALPNPFAGMITDENYMWFAAFPVILGMFIAIVDSSIVNVAMPHIMAAFGAGVEDIEWVSTGYMLAAALMMSMTGFLGDRFGRKKLYTVALLLFTLISGLCGFAWSINSLVFFRVLQGMTGGMLQPIGQAILFEAFPPEKRGMSMALVGLGAMFAPMVGPTLGGYLVDCLSWRWIFYVNLPFGFLASFIALSVLRESRRKPVKFDGWGFLSMALFLPTLLLAISQGNSKGWTSEYIVGLFAVAMVLFAFFLVVMFWRREPIVDLRLFRYTTYSAGTITSIVMGIGSFGGIFLMPMFLQGLMGYTAIQTGLLMMPQALIMGALMPVAGALLNRIDPRIQIVAGLFLMGIAMLLQSTMTPETSVWLLVGWTTLRGVGMAIMFPAMNQTALGAVPIQKIGQASGLFSVTRQVGSTFGIALIANLLTQRLAFHMATLGQDMARNGIARPFLAGLLGPLVRHGASLPLAQQQASALFGQLALRQVQIAAYQDTFWVAGWIILAGILPACFVIKREHPWEASHR